MLAHRRTKSTLAGAALLTAMIAPATAAPTTYSLVSTIAVPPSATNLNPGGAFTAFDISTFNPTTRLAYIADRSNSSVDIFSGASRSFVGQVGGFVGQQASNETSGPDGVLTLTSGSSHLLFAGDGNSTVKVFNLATPSAPSLLAAIGTGGSFRTDELAYSPSANLVLAINNADAPAFGTLLNATTGAIVHSNITIPGGHASDGLEQPVWDPVTNSFFVSVPQVAGTDPGGIAQINIDGTVGQVFNLASFGIGACSPAGLAVGTNGTLAIACNAPGSQTVLFNPTGNGAIVGTTPGIGGSDEVTFDVALNDFFLSSISAGGVALDVISANDGTLLQSIGGLPFTHSLTVDSVSGDVFVPFGANNPVFPNTICPGGCVGVFAQSVPEPGTLPLFGVALAGLAVLGWRRRLPSLFKGGIGGG